MDRIKTVFVLGAGASWDYGYPLGPQLVDIMSRPHLQADSPLIPRLNEVADFADKLLKSGCNSIDVFLEGCPHLMEIGTEYLLDCLGDCEHAGRYRLFGLHVDDHWYKYLYNVLLPDGAKLNDLYGLNLSFVTFNYDRSLEEFWWNALQHRFDIDGTTAAEQMANCVPIYHVYGDMGPLPWQKDSDGLARDYGERWKADILTNCRDRIKLLTNSGMTDNLANARKAISEAHRIIFLGFGYHRTNMKRLSIEYVAKGTIMCGTAYRMSGARVDRISSKYKITMGLVIHGIPQFLEESPDFLLDVEV